MGMGADDLLLQLCVGPTDRICVGRYATVVKVLRVQALLVACCCHPRQLPADSPVRIMATRVALAA